MFDVKNIRHLVALYEEGSVTHAAERLHVSQPTLTAHLGRLESLIGERLFVRTAQGLSPTPTGKYLYRKGKVMLRKWQAFERETKLVSGAEVGELRMQCGAAIAEGILPRAMAQFREKRQNVKLYVDVINPERMQAAILEGDTDIAIGAFPQLEDSDFERMDITPIALGYFARPQHPLHKVPEVTSWEGYHFALPEVPLDILAWMKDKGFSLEQRYLVTDNFSLLKQAAITSDLIVGGPHSIFIEELACGTLRRLPVSDSPTWHPAILISPSARYSRVVQAMAECIRAEMDELSRNVVQ